MKGDIPIGEDTSGMIHRAAKGCPSQTEAALPTSGESSYPSRTLAGRTRPINGAGSGGHNGPTHRRKARVAGPKGCSVCVGVADSLIRAAFQLYIDEGEIPIGEDDDGVLHRAAEGGTSQGEPVPPAPEGQSSHP